MSEQEWVEIGSGHTYRFVYFEGEGEKKGSLYGLEESHLLPGGKECKGFIPFNTFGKTTGWDLVSKEPLTLAPSLACSSCSSHGFIQDGKWVE